MLTAQNGAGILADVSYAIPDGVEFGLPWYWQFYVWGTRGTIRFSLNEERSCYYLAGQKEPILLEETEVQKELYRQKKSEKKLKNKQRMEAHEQKKKAKT
mgnify:CR=1 FL=1